MNEKTIPHNFGAEILAKIKSRQKELGVSFDTFAQAIGIPKSTLRDIYASDGAGLKHEFVARSCLFLGLTLEGDVQQVEEKPIAQVTNVDITESQHDDVAKNNAQMLSERKERIEELETVNIELTAKLEEATARYNTASADHHKRIEDLLHRVDTLTQELVRCHTDLIETHRQYAERIDKLQTELNDRHREMTDFIRNVYKKAED